MRKISPDRAVQKVTRIKECGTQTATKKTNEAESVSSPSGCSEKPVLAKPACKQSKTESINSPAGCSEKPVSINVCGNKVKFNKMRNYLGSYATYPTFYEEAYVITVNNGQTFEKVIVMGASSHSLFVEKFQEKIH